MFKNYTENLYKNKNLHAYRYGYAEEFESKVNYIKPILVATISTVVACVGILSGGLPLGIALGIVAAVFIQLTFVDFLAAIVPNPLSKEVLDENPIQGMVLKAVKTITHSLLQKGSANIAGKAKGREAAESINRELDELVHKPSRIFSCFS